MNIIKRREAIKLGLKRYFTGKPCKNGHICERQVSSYVCPTCKSLRAKKWRKENPLLYKERYQGEYKRNKSSILARNKKWAAKNSEYLKEHVRNHPSSKQWRSNAKAKRRGAKGIHTKEDICFLLKSQKYKCVNCRESIKEKYEIDHIMPVKLGGTNYKNNLQLLCRGCNRKKYTKHPIDWAQENGRLL